MEDVVDSNVLLDEIISSPLTLVHAAFSEAFAAAGGYDPCWADSVPARFIAALASDAALARVPLLTASALHRGAIRADTLVRFVGMVQDNFDPEWYVATAKAAGSGTPIPCGFRSSFPEGFEANFDTLERR